MTHHKTELANVQVRLMTIVITQKIPDSMYRKFLHQVEKSQLHQMKQNFLPIRTNLKASKVLKDKDRHISEDIPSSTSLRKINTQEVMTNC